MFTIKVIDRRNGQPVEGKKVQIFFDGFFRGHTGEQYTSSDGESHFSEDNGHGEVFVGRERVYRGDIGGRVVVYI